MANTPDKGSPSSAAHRSPSPSPSPPPPPPAATRPRALPRQWPPPVMGVPGVTAFTPVSSPHHPPPPSPPPPSPPRPPAPPSAEPHAGAGGFPTGAVGIAVGGGSAAAGGGSGAPALRIGGSPASRKRGRDGNTLAASGGAGEGGGGGEEQRPVICSICNKEFATPKALFGHMRSHPDRGWKGAHPPPAFRAEDEFADLRPLYRPPEPPAADAPQGGAQPAEGGEGDQPAAEQGRKEAEEGEQSYRVPDLNKLNEDNQ